MASQPRSHALDIGLFLEFSLPENILDIRDAYLVATGRLGEALAGALERSKVRLVGYNWTWWLLHLERHPASSVHASALRPCANPSSQMCVLPLQPGSKVHAVMERIVGGALREAATRRRGQAAFNALAAGMGPLAGRACAPSAALCWLQNQHEPPGNRESQFGV